MGGPIAQLLWHRHRSLVEGLVLCATSRNFRGRPQEQALTPLLPFFAVAARTGPRSARRAIVNRWVERRIAGFPARDWILEELGGNDAATVAQAMHAVGRFTSHDWIGDVDVPTAVVVTQHDRLVRPNRQLKLAAAIPGATFHPVAGDHGVCVARPDLFVPALLDACNTVSARTPRTV
jgi:pimeloyl-ACP methyl ester carboxylesterase